MAGAKREFVSGHYYNARGRWFICAYNAKRAEPKFCSLLLVRVTRFELAASWTPFKGKSLYSLHFSAIWMQRRCNTFEKSISILLRIILESSSNLNIQNSTFLLYQKYTKKQVYYWEQSTFNYWSRSFFCFSVNIGSRATATRKQPWLAGVLAEAWRARAAPLVLPKPTNLATCPMRQP